VVQRLAADPVTAVASPRSWADELLSPVASLPAARDRDVEQAVKETAANFQRSASMRLNAVETEVSAKAAEIEAALASLQATVDTTTSETQSTVTSQATAFEAKLAEFEATLTNQRQAVSDALERQSETFTQTQADRAESFQDEVSLSRGSRSRRS
jgi:hypothetical protein